MAKLTIEWIETKGPDWKLANLIGADKTGYKDVSINRTSKKGEVFPNFDTLQNGGEVEGELWQSPAQKWYLFPPKPESTSGGAPRGSGGYKTVQIEKAMDKKNEAIGRFQATKEESIRQVSAQRDAVLIVVNLYRERLATDPILSETELDAIIKKKIVQFRDWFLSTDFTETLPFSEDGTK